MEAPRDPARYREIWDAKPALRAVYGEYYERILAACRSGPIVEVGAGAGNLKQAIPRAIASDVVASPWLDLALDAHQLPFADASITNLVGVDVLHHIERPIRFLREASRVLRPGGRLVLMEPAITPLSWVSFKLLHPEPVDMRADPLEDGRLSDDRHPLDSNQAVPSLLAGRFRHQLDQAVPGLSLATRERMSLFAYPLSGGFRPWSLVPRRLVRPLLTLERRVCPVLGWVMAFRLFMIFEREAIESNNRDQQRTPF